MATLIAVGIGCYAFRVFANDVGWPWYGAALIGLLLVGFTLIPGMGGFLGIIILIGTALMLGMV